MAFEEFYENLSDNARLLLSGEPSEFPQEALDAAMYEWMKICEQVVQQAGLNYVHFEKDAMPPMFDYLTTIVMFIIKLRKETDSGNMPALCGEAQSIISRAPGMFDQYQIAIETRREEIQANFRKMNEEMDRSQFSRGGQGAMTPIPTRYGGVEFRSRLEARWAVLFDTLGIQWLYEHEGYEVDGQRYLPDFWLPDAYMRVENVRGVLFEVKPSNHPHTHNMLETIANRLGVGGILACGMPLNNDRILDHLTEIAPDWDENMELRVCPRGHASFDFGASGSFGCPVCNSAEHIYYSQDRLEDAIRTANTYKFW